MWISPKFHLQVIRAYDSGQQKQTPALPDFSNRAAAARAWGDEVEQKMAALELIEANRHRHEVEFIEKVSNLDGSCTVKSSNYVESGDC
jgi:hypothetical protein